MSRAFVWCLTVLGILFASPRTAPAQINVGRFQLVSVSAGQQAGVFLIDTASGCAWQLGSNPQTKRLTFIEMDVENLHWSWGSGAQQQLGRKIDESSLSSEQKQLLKQELQKTACGWTPIVLTPPPTAPTTTPPAAPPAKREAQPTKKK
jgi:hypothetical protein